MTPTGVLNPPGFILAQDQQVCNFGDLASPGLSFLTHEMELALGEK